jgi:vacuolar protein sorting-associated protein 26
MANPVPGAVSSLSRGKKVDHLGVKIEVLGQIELYFDRGNAYDFVSLVREVAPPGELQGPLSIPFEFTRVEMPYESYHGGAVHVGFQFTHSLKGAWFQLLYL